MVEPDLSFTYAGYKLSWAEQHIRHLKQESEAFIRKNPARISLEGNIKTRRLGVVFRPPEHIDPIIALVAGDAAHNIRASLDYCWMGLVRALHGETAKKKTFPFSNSFEGLKGTVTKALEDLPIQGLETVILDCVKAFDAANPLLAAVNAMDNRDKHNLLVLTVTAAKVISLKLRTPSGRTEVGPLSETAWRLG